MKPLRVLALAVLAIGLTGCVTPTVTSTPDTASQEAGISAASESPTVGEASETPAAQQAATVGDTITLKDSTETRQIAVKLNKVIAKGPAANDMVKAEAGKRLYGVELILKNTGGGVWDDSPGSGAKVIDAEGQEYEASLFGEIAGTHPMGSITLAPGKARKGVVAFEVPADAKVVEFLMALSSGYAEQKGSWTIK